MDSMSINRVNSFSPTPDRKDPEPEDKQQKAKKNMKPAEEQSASERERASETSRSKQAIGVVGGIDHKNETIGDMR